MNQTIAAQPIEIRREKIYIPPGLSTREIRERYGLKPCNAYVARNRGWFIKNYKKKQIITQCKARHRHQEFLNVLHHIDASVPQGS